MQKYIGNEYRNWKAWNTGNIKTAKHQSNTDLLFSFNITPYNIIIGYGKTCVLWDVELMVIIVTFSNVVNWDSYNVLTTETPSLPDDLWVSGVNPCQWWEAFTIPHPCPILLLEKPLNFVSVTFHHVSACFHQLKNYMRI